MEYDFYIYNRKYKIIYKNGFYTCGYLRDKDIDFIKARIIKCNNNLKKRGL